MTRSQEARLLLALLVLWAAGSNWRAIALLGAPVSLGGAAVLIYLGLSIACLCGLLVGRAWGFLALYLLVPFGTVMLAVTFVPVSLRFLPVSVRWIGLAIVNAAVVTFAGLAHHWLRRDLAVPPGRAA